MCCNRVMEHTCLTKKLMPADLPLLTSQVKCNGYRNVKCEHFKFMCIVSVGVNFFKQRNFCEHLIYFLLNHIV